MRRSSNPPDWEVHTPVALITRLTRDEVRIEISFVTACSAGTALIGDRQCSIQSNSVKVVPSSLPNDAWHGKAWAVRAKEAPDFLHSARHWLYRHEAEEIYRRLGLGELSDPEAFRHQPFLLELAVDSRLLPPRLAYHRSGGRRLCIA